MLLGVLAFSGCLRKKAAESPSWSLQQPGAAAAPAGARAGTSQLTVTPETVLIGKVIGVNTAGRFVVLNFPLGRMAAQEQRLNLYRQGVKVGEVKITGPQREDNTVADLIAGEADVGDVARSQ